MSDTLKRNRIAFYIWLVFIFTVTSIPGLQITEDRLFGIDKSAHFVMYLILAFLYYRMKRYKPELLVVKGLFILALTLPLLDEIHQIPIAGRNFSWLDLIADISGFLVILLLIRTKVLKTGPGQDRNS